MKKLMAAVLLTCVVPLVAAAQVVNPKDFPVKVSVLSSASKVYVFEGSKFRYYQVLNVTIDGRPAELTSDYDVGGVLQPMEYRARAFPQSVPTPNGHDLFQAYEVLFLDGTARVYTVTRLGPPAGVTQ